MDLVQQNSRGMSPPVAHFVAAWATTVHHFSEQVQISGKPLLEFVVNTGAWEHRWYWAAPAGTSGNSGSTVDLPPYIAADVEQMREQARNKGKTGGGRGKDSDRQRDARDRDGYRERSRHR